MMRDMARWSWIAGGAAGVWCFLDWIEGGSTSLPFFAASQLICAILFLTADWILMRWRQRRERQEIKTKLRILQAIKEEMQRAKAMSGEG